MIFDIWWLKNLNTNEQNIEKFFKKSPNMRLKFNYILQISKISAPAIEKKSSIYLIIRMFRRSLNESLKKK